MHARIRQASLVTAIAMTSAIVFGGAALAQSSDPLIGTWKLNVAKSKSSFKSGTTTIEAAGTGLKLTADVVAADGTANHWTVTANFDGKDNPVVGTSPYGDMAAFTRIDARTIRIVSKQGGKPTVTQTIAVSVDGKTRTTTTKGTDAKGQTIDSVAIYDKQ
jgi:uncharacterized cupredoxin-like copper-binding protein